MNGKLPALTLDLIFMSSSLFAQYVKPGRARTGRQCQPPSREPASDYALVIESAGEREASRLNVGFDDHDFLLTQLDG